MRSRIPSKAQSDIPSTEAD